MRGVEATLKRKRRAFQNFPESISTSSKQRVPSPHWSGFHFLSNGKVNRRACRRRSPKTCPAPSEARINKWTKHRARRLCTGPQFTCPTVTTFSFHLCFYH
ncbi:hypothetical protein CDAR_50361 [Caerostris darwini]|uniref:Uncharacterized protein n=1 Tax=Caerostris darwini TaxID=1538125 RepID=A0AAV4UXK8_9ARAC|nr:hypothetical protein CDAR_50361 [Caerostris darwini]